MNKNRLLAVYTGPKQRLVIEPNLRTETTKTIPYLAARTYKAHTWEYTRGERNDNH